MTDRPGVPRRTALPARRATRLEEGWQVAVAPWRLEDAHGDPLAAVAAAGLELSPLDRPESLWSHLQAAGRIRDPYAGTGVLDTVGLEGAYLYYVCEFEHQRQPEAMVDLVFHGVDCDATISLNGRVLGIAENMLIEHRFDVGRVLPPDGRNVLVVEIAPALDRARTLGERFGPGLAAEGLGYASLYVRKAPHMFGWDIMPRQLTAGIWRPVELQERPPVALQWVWVDTEWIDAGRNVAGIAVHYHLSGAADQTGLALAVSGRGSASSFECSTSLLFDYGVVRFEVADPELWWPRGRGTPHLYSVDVALLSHGALLDTWSATAGIRTVELEHRSPAHDGDRGEFLFRVNGEPVYVHGTNWVPLDVWHSRDPERLGEALALVEEVGCNMVRCWGGNVYESDDFYDWCDRHGVMVWQDFAMACAIYPQDQDFQRVLTLEVTSVVRRLRQHASIVVWAGDNECDEQYVWKHRRRNPAGNVLTRSTIPAVLKVEDPSRPYLPSSPLVDPVAFERGGRYLAEDHLWGPRDFHKSEYYLTATAAFCSEIGYFGCPSPTSVRRFISPESLWPPTNEEWRLHGVSPFPDQPDHEYRVPLMLSQVERMFATVPDSLEEFVAASQVCQSEAMKFFIERFRVGKWDRTGMIWWNLLDGWPQFSDAVVDYYFGKKRAFHQIKVCQEAVAVIVDEPSGPSARVLVSNDTRFPEAVTVEVVDLSNGQVLLDGRLVADSDAVTEAGEIRIPQGQGVLGVTCRREASSWVGHYLFGQAPFKLNEVLAWLDDLESLRRAEGLAPTGGIAS